MYIFLVLNYVGVKKIVEYNITPKSTYNYNCKQYVYYNVNLCLKYVRPVGMKSNQDQSCINTIKNE